MGQTNGLVGTFDDLNEFHRKKRICSNYNLTSSNLRGSSQREQEKGSGFSVSFAAGIKLGYRDKKGFSLEVLTPDEIANEQSTSRKRVAIQADKNKGHNLNIYC